MIYAFIVAVVLAGVFTGVSVHQHRVIERKEEEADGLREEVILLSSRLAEANAEIAAHVTSLSMLMGEVAREDDATS